MTLENIYDTLTSGSNGFCAAVEFHIGIDCSRDEIERIANVSPDAATFMYVWENEGHWLDENN